MSISRNIILTVSVFSILLPLVLSSNHSHARKSYSPITRTFIESFESGDPSLMLGGQINFRREKSNWLNYVSNGKLVLENRLDPKSIFHDDIEWVKYPGVNILSSTEESVISVTVESYNQGRGGAGILVGSGQQGVYWGFVVDGQGKYHVFRKNGGRDTNTAHSARHAAITIGEPNQLTFSRRGDNLVFFVNNEEIVEVPNGKRKRNSRRLGEAGIGITAFGLGTYTFDDLRITN